MSTTQEQAKEFYDFVIQELSRHPENSLDELYDLWRTDHPTIEEYEINVKAIQQSLDDLENGKQPQSFAEFASNFRTINSINDSQ